MSKNLDINTSFEIICEAVSLSQFCVVGGYINRWEFINAVCITIDFEAADTREFVWLLHRLQNLTHPVGIILCEGYNPGYTRLSRRMNCIQSSMNYNLVSR